MDGKEVQPMKGKPFPAVTFYPGGPAHVRFELRLSDRYTLIGDYVHGALKGVTLYKRHAGPQGDPKPSAR